MSSTASRPSSAENISTRPAATDSTWLRLVQGSVALLVVPLVILSTVMLFFTTTPDEGHFQHTADYWLTATGIPLALGLLGVVVGLHRLQHGADGRLGVIGTWVASLALVELFFQLVASVITSSEVRWGPSYPIATLLLFLGLALLAAGSWRNEVLPRWVLGLMPLALVGGTMASFGPTPLVLVAFLVILVVALTQRIDARSR